MDPRTSAFLRVGAGESYRRGPRHLGRWRRAIGTGPTVQGTEEELAEVERDIGLAGETA
jgi:hypothetical protein